MTNTVRLGLIPSFFSTLLGTASPTYMHIDVFWILAFAGMTGLVNTTYAALRALTHIPSEAATFKVSILVKPQCA